MVSLRERGKYIGILSVASALGLIAGILIGAAVSDLASWRLYVFSKYCLKSILIKFRRIFYINLPLCVPSIAGIYFFINLESEPGSTKERLQRVDWVGIVLSTASLISLLFGITSGGVLHPWKSAQVISSIIIGVIGFGVFLFYESRFPKHPMIPLRIFANRTAMAAFGSAFVLGFVLWAMQYYLILYVSSTGPYHPFSC